MFEVLDPFLWLAGVIAVLFLTGLLASMLTEEWLARPWQMLFAGIGVFVIAALIPDLVPGWVWAATAAAWYLSLLASLVARLGRGFSREHNHGDFWHSHPNHGLHTHPHGDDRVVYVEHERN